LKWARVVDTGGRAKVLIMSGGIRVNGRVERRRGRQLRPGDRVQGPRGLYLVIERA
jgi:ribosome-associated protein